MMTGELGQLGSDCPDLGAMVRIGRLFGSVLVLATVGVLAPTLSVAASSASPTPVQAAFTGFQAAVATATATAQAQPNAAGAQNQGFAAAFVHELAQFDLDNQLGAVDSNNPILFRNPDPFSVPGIDPPNPSGIWNPDNVNYIAVISGAGTYQLSGIRGNSVDLSFQAISGFPGDDTTGTPTATLSLPQLAVNPSGSYAISIGQAPQSDNWLPTTAQTTVLSIRETFNNWGAAVPDQLHLIRVDQTGPPLVHLSSSQMVAALNAASGQVIEESAYWDAYWTALLARLPANFVIPASSTVGGLPTQISSLDHFDLAPGQALVINVPPDPYSAYQGLEVADVWGQTLPYATHEASLNATQAYLGSDGLYHFVISATDPGVPNWIDTDGHSEGFVFLRWQANTGPFTSSDNPTGGLVSLSNLSSLLPAGTPKVTPTQRAIQLVLRDLTVAKRVVLSSNPARPVLANYLGQIEAQVGSQTLHTIYPTVVS
jgi:hypothetical protein